MGSPCIGQVCVLQVVFSELEPVQAKPPFEGGGLLQVRDLVCAPPPQVRLHVDQAPQSPQFPSGHRKNVFLITTLVICNTFILKIIL